MVTIPSKDAPLEQSIAHFQSQLQQLGITINQQSWLNPVNNIYSVHINNTDCPQMFTNGKGISEQAALASALGEFVERLLTRYFWADYHVGVRPSEINNTPVTFSQHPNERWFSATQFDEVLDDALKQAYQIKDADDLAQLAAVQSDSANTKEQAPEQAKNNQTSDATICAIPFTPLNSSEPVYVPSNILDNLYASNGMASGNTAAETQVQALSEIIERAIKFRIIQQQWCLPDIPEQDLANYPAITQAIEEIRSAGYTLVIKDASLGGQYPVACVCLVHPQDYGVFASFGAHPNFYVALERSLTELLQGRDLDALKGFPVPSHDDEFVASYENLESHFIDSSGLLAWHFFAGQADFEYTPWDHGSDSQTELAYLHGLITDQGFGVYTADYHANELYACRIIVPGLSEVYPMVELFENNNNRGQTLRRALTDYTENQQSSADSRAKAAPKLLELIDQTGIVDDALVAPSLGLFAQADSIYQDLRIAELRLILACISQDEDRVFEGLDWAIWFAQINPQRLAVYQCANEMLSEDIDSIESSSINYAQVFGEHTHQQALQLLDGENVFDLSYQSTVHQTLMQQYWTYSAKLSAD